MRPLSPLQNVRTSSVPRSLRRWQTLPIMLIAVLFLWAMYGLKHTFHAVKASTTLLVSNTIPSPESSGPSVNLVIAATAKQRHEWASQVTIPNLNIIPYIVDNPNATYHPRQNKGHEAMIILTYLHDFYDTLPAISIFTHGDDLAWHNEPLLNSSIAITLNNLDLGEAQRRGYMSLSTSWVNACPNWIHMDVTAGSPEFNQLKREEPYMAAAFKQHFPDDEMPGVMSAPCCSQFAVTRNSVQRKTKSDYANYISYLLSSELPDELSGRIWEHWWQYLFLEKAIDCPVEYKALCAGFHVCFEYQWEFEDYNVLMREKGAKNGERDELRNQKPVDKNRLDNLSFKIRQLEREMDMRKALAMEDGGNLEKREEILGGDLYHADL